MHDIGNMTGDDAIGHDADAEMRECAWAFSLYSILDARKEDAARFRAAAKCTTGSECKNNIELAEKAEAEIARIDAELVAGYRAQNQVTAALHDAAASANVNFPVQADRIKGEAQGSEQRTRRDDIQIEIDDVIKDLKAGGEDIAAPKVMEILRKRAGRPDSCVNAQTPDGLTWTRRSLGRVEELTTKALHKRIRRRRKVPPR